MKIRLSTKRGLVHNCETPKAWAVKCSGRMVFVPKSKSVLTPVESSKYINGGQEEYLYYDLVVSNNFLQGKDDLIETLTDIYHLNKMLHSNKSDVPFVQPTREVDYERKAFDDLATHKERFSYDD